MFQPLKDIVFDIFFDLIEDIIKPFKDLDSLSDLVFGSDLIYLTFTESEWNNIVVGGVSVTVSIAYLFILAAIIYMSMQISKMGINPASRTSLLEMAGSLLFVTLLIHNLDTLFSVMFSVNKFLVQVFQVEMQNKGLSFSKMDDGLGQLFIWCAYLGLSLWANVYYLMRKFTLIILIILSPLFISMFLFPAFRGITGAWLRELFATIIVQAIHAIILWIYLGFNESVTDNWVVKLVILASFIPAAEGVKSLIGLNASMTGRAAMITMATGAAGLSSMFSAAQSAFGNKSAYDNLSEKYLGRKGNKPTAGDGAQSNTGDSTNISRGVPQSTKTAKMLRWGKIGGNLGKAAGTLMGAAAGMPLGPGGVVAGGIAGGKAGEGAGQLSSRALKGAFDGATSIADRARQSVNASINNELDQLNTKYGTNPIEERGLHGYSPRAAATAVGTLKGLTRVPRELRMLGRVGKAAYNGAKEGISLGSQSNEPFNAITKIRSGIQQAVSAAGNEVTAGIIESGGFAQAKMQSLDKVNYLGAMVAGESGIKAATAITSAIGPVRGLNQQIKQRGLEYSDVANNPNMHSVRLAVTKEHSSMLAMVRQNNGQFVEQRISDYRAGDSSLKDGQVVYKDFHFNSGRLMEGSSPNDIKPVFYTEDSQGGQVESNRKYNVNPYDYFEDRNNGSEKYFRPDRFKQGIV